MELLVVALEEAERARKLPFLARGEGDVQRGGLEPVGQRRRGLQQERLALGPVRAIAHQQPPTRNRREGHGGLQLRIVAAAGALIGVGPGVIENIFAVGMRFQIAGHAGGDAASCVLQNEMLRQPAGRARRRSALFQRVQKGMADERVVRARCVTARIVATRASVPLRSRYRGDALDHADDRAFGTFRALFDIAYGSIPSKIMASAKSFALALSASLRTVQVSSGRRKTSRAIPGASAGSALIS